jgi:hypothetical protein
MDEERTELVILLEAIKENIMRNPGKGIWFGIIMCNGKEYHWKVTEKSLDYLAGEDDERIPD